MHPTLQTSMANVYSLNVNIISGARYHRVATYLFIHTIRDGRGNERNGTHSVMNPTASCSPTNALRASPKSQIYSVMHQYTPLPPI
jgi:hypothetical protein